MWVRVAKRGAANLVFLWLAIWSVSQELDRLPSAILGDLMDGMTKGTPLFVCTEWTLFKIWSLQVLHTYFLCGDWSPWSVCPLDITPLHLGGGTFWSTLDWIHLLITCLISCVADPYGNLYAKYNALLVKTCMSKCVKELSILIISSAIISFLIQVSNKWSSTNHVLLILSF